MIKLTKEMVKDLESQEEIELSEQATKDLGYPCLVYKDGDWICDPIRSARFMGFGETASEAIENCKQRNL